MKKKAPTRQKSRKAAPIHSAPAPKVEVVNEPPPPRIAGRPLFRLPRVPRANGNGQPSVNPLGPSLLTGGDLQTGETFVDGQQVFAADLNNAVNNATVQPGFVSSKPTSTPLSGDTGIFLQASSGQLKQAPLSQIGATAPLNAIGLNMPNDDFFTNGVATTVTLSANGTFTVTKRNQFANCVLIAPNGANGVPVYRRLIPADLSPPANGPTGTAIDWNAGNFHYRLLTASNTTLTFLNPCDARILLCLQQGGSGSCLVTWPTGINWDTGGPPTLSTVVGAHDIIELFRMGAPGPGFFGKLWGRS